MKILHTADWHLGKRLESFSRLEEQKQVLNEICTIAETNEIDLVLIAGDLFDNFNPSTEAIDLFYKTLKRLSADGRRAVFAIAGNHDSPERIEAPDPLARECGIFFAGFPNSTINPCKLQSSIEILNSEPGFVEFKNDKYPYPVRLLLTPYANEIRLRTIFESEDREDELREVLQHQWTKLANKYCDENGINLLIAHLFVAEENQALPEEPDDEKSILQVGGAQAIFTSNIPPQIQYTALGHLHRYIRMGQKEKPVIYSSSPLAYTFSEADQDKFVVIADLQPGKIVNYEKIKLENGRRLIRKKFDDISLCVEWLRSNQNCLVELTIVTDEFLSGVQRKQLYEAHDGIVTIIPEVRNKETINGKESLVVDPGKDIESLFNEFFFSKLGQSPNDDIKNLFKEIVNQNK